MDGAAAGAVQGARRPDKMAAQSCVQRQIAAGGSGAWQAGVQRTGRPMVARRTAPMGARATTGQPGAARVVSARSNRAVAGGTRQRADQPRQAPVGAAAVRGVGREVWRTILMCYETAILH